MIAAQLLLLRAAAPLGSNGADGVRYVGNFGISAVGAGLERDHGDDGERGAGRGRRGRAPRRSGDGRGRWHAGPPEALGLK